MAWNAWLCDTRTGGGRVRVPAQSFSWERVLNGGGSGEASFQLLDWSTAEVVTWESTKPVRSTLVLDWDGVVVYAGIIWTREYVRNTGVLTLGHSDIWSILEQRMVLSSRVNGAEKTTLGWSGLSFPTLCKFIVQSGVDAGSNALKLPIDYPADVAGTRGAEYKGYHLVPVAEALREQIGTDGGPDIDFKPYWNSANELRYEMRVGELRTGNWRWHVPARDSDVFSPIFRDDASKLTTRYFGVGEGSEEDMKLRIINDPFSPYPALERQFSMKQQSGIDGIEALLQDKFRAYHRVTGQVEFAASVGGAPKLTDILLGGTAHTYHQGDPWIAHGDYADRIIRLSGDMSERFSVFTQPLGV